MITSVQFSYPTRIYRQRALAECLMVKLMLRLKVTLKILYVKAFSPGRKVWQEEKGWVPDYFGFVSAIHLKMIFILLITLMPFVFLS